MAITGFTKLSADIVTSSVWVKDDHVLRVWIGMLALADENGVVTGSVIGLANLFRVTPEKMQEALNLFMSSDEFSRTKDFDGRRIDVIEGGWVLLNYDKYRAKREDRKEYMRGYMRDYRNKHVNTVNANVNDGNQQLSKLAQAEAEAEAEAERTTTTCRNSVPFADIVGLYHELLPELPKCIKLTDARRGMIRQRWLQDLSDLNAWREYFAIVRKSDFLMGRARPTGDRQPFRADLMWLCKAENICKVIEGKYHAKNNRKV